MHMGNEQLKIVPYESSHYEEISTYYVGHGWPAAPAEDMLPDTGYVVLCGDEKLAVGFVYASNSNVYFLEWTATNPKAPLKKRVLAFKLMIRAIQEICKMAKPRARIMQFTPNRAIIRMYEKMGFVATEDATLLLWQ
jgi:hypothetical protein